MIYSDSSDAVRIFPVRRTQHHEEVRIRFVSRDGSAIPTVRRQTAASRRVARHLWRKSGIMPLSRDLNAALHAGPSFATIDDIWLRATTSWCS